MTGDDLDRAHLAIGLRLSTYEPVGLTWQDWSMQLERRLRLVQSYAVDGLRPSHDAALLLAAEATAMLVDVAKAGAPVGAKKAARS